MSYFDPERDTNLVPYIIPGKNGILVLEASPNFDPAKISSLMCAYMVKTDEIESDVHCIDLTSDTPTDIYS